MEKKIYCFWTGTNKMSEQRRGCLELLKTDSECDVILVNQDNLPEYILPDEPLHPAYVYLSETHKADYLRAYFMNFYGGGYSDIKMPTGSWKNSFEYLENSDAWICGYKEIESGVSVEWLRENYNDLIGNGAYICKPKTPITRIWYNEILCILDEKLELLKLHPSTFPQDCSELNKGYPLAWSEICSSIFHKVCYNCRNRLLYTLPRPIFHNYR